MKPFTVVYTQDMPMGSGVAAFHCSTETAENADEAAKQCKRSLGGYSTIILVLEGYQMPVLKGQHTHVWKNDVKYKTKEIEVRVFEGSKPG